MARLLQDQNTSKQSSLSQIEFIPILIPYNITVLADCPSQFKDERLGMELVKDIQFIPWGRKTRPGSE